MSDPWFFLIKEIFMSTKKVFVLTAIFTFALALSGCAGSLSNTAYTTQQARTAMIVKMGVVDSVRPVKIEGQTTGTGAAAGTSAGAVIGSNIGRGRGGLLGILAGAVAGGVAGHMAEKGMNSKDGLEITVKLDNGEMLAVTQEADEKFSAGERVRVLSDARGTTRVSH
jgi:outer membrane lipoprotein SlyB